MLPSKASVWTPRAEGNTLPSHPRRRTEAPREHAAGRCTCDRSDPELWTLVRGGDVEAFAELYDRHARVAHGLACRIVGRSAAEDVTQAAFLTLWRSRDGYRPDRGAFRPWLLAVVRNRAIDALRRDRARPRIARSYDATHYLETVASTSDGSPEEHACDRDEARRVRAALATLPEAQRCVIELAYFNGLSQTEIADELSLPLGTVKGRARLGLEKLGRRLAVGPTSRASANGEEPAIAAQPGSMSAFPPNVIQRRSQPPRSVHRPA